MIRIYPSMLPGAPIETHDTTQALSEWLTDNVHGYDSNADSHPIVVKQCGQIVSPAQWHTVCPSSDRPVDIYITPQSGAVDAIGSVFDAVIGVFQDVFSFLMPDVPDVNAGSRERGGEIERVDVKANTPRLNAVIPNQGGRFRTFPDYLNEPRRYFSSPKEQVLELFLSLGAGEYDVETENLRIGETPFDALGATVDYQIFEPGADVSVRPEHRVWYNVSEVGSTTGSAGIALLSTRDITQEVTDATASGTTLSTSQDPQGWDQDLILRLAFDQPVTVTRDTPGDPSTDNVYEADIEWLQPSNGLEILLATDSSTALHRRIADYDAGAGTFKLEFFDGSAWVPTQGVTEGNYDWRFTRWPEAYESYRITSSGGTSPFSVVLQLSGADVAGWSGFPAGATGVIVDVDLSFAEGLWSKTFNACPPNETTKRIEVDVFAPRGLGVAQDNGDMEPLDRTIEFRYRTAGTADPWQVLSNSITGRTRDQLGWTFRFDLPDFTTPEVQLRRVEPQSNEISNLDELEWIGLRSDLDTAPSSYPGVTTIAVKITGTTQLSAVSDNQINVTQTRKLNGVATRSIADFLSYVLDDAGLSADEIDSAEIARLGDIWDARGDTFDFIHGRGETVHDVIKRILRAGFSEYTLFDGKITPVRDEPRTTFEHMYTPQNMTEGGLTRTVTPARDDDIDGVDVTFTDEDSWTRQTVECRLPGDAGIRAEKITLDGVINRTRAWRIGMRLRTAMRYRRRAYSFGTEMDALNSRYLSYVALADDVPGYTQTGLILGVSGAGTVTVTTSEPLTWEVGETHVIAWRRPDGTLAGPYTATQGADDYTVIFTGDTPAVDYSQELPHYMLGVSQRFAYPAIIQSINPQGYESVNVEAVNYDDRVYDYDDLEPPA